MSVPSRSRKMAGEVSLGGPVILKARRQFFARDRRRTHFADYDRARVIGDIGCFDCRRVATKRKSKQRDGSVAGAGNVEHLSRFCRDMMRLFPTLEKHHTVLAESDKEQLRLPFF